jgi:hypothetical protein
MTESKRINGGSKGTDIEHIRRQRDGQNVFDRLLINCMISPNEWVAAKWLLKEVATLRACEVFDSLESLMEAPPLSVVSIGEGDDEHPPVTLPDSIEVRSALGSVLVGASEPVRSLLLGLFDSPFTAATIDELQVIGKVISHRLRSLSDWYGVSEAQDPRVVMKRGLYLGPLNERSSLGW